MGVMKKEAELGGTKFCHKEERVVPGNEASSEVDEVGFRAMNEDVGQSKARMVMWAQGVVTCARSKMVRVVCVEGVTRDQLKACQLKITGASN